MSRTLNDDFDEDDLPSGSLDLEKGSSGHVGSGVSSSYGGEGMDFDDELYGDEGQAAGGLELDLPHQHQAHHSGAPSGSVSRAPQPPAPSLKPNAGGPVVPDLAFDEAPRSQPSKKPAPVPSKAAPPPPPSSHPQMQQPPPSSQPRAEAPPSSQPHGFSQAPSSDPNLQASASGGHEMGGPPPPPAKPTAASVIAKYPPAPAKIWEAPKYAFQVVLRQFELRSDLESLRRRRSPDVPLYEAALRAYDPKTFRLGMAISCAAFAVATFIFFLPVMIRFMRAD